jgi:hypothetical protein
MAGETCNASKIAFGIVHDLLESDGGATMDEIEAAVREKGGMMQLAPSYYVGDYIDDCVRQGSVIHDRETGKYTFRFESWE